MTDEPVATVPDATKHTIACGTFKYQIERPQATIPLNGGGVFARYLASTFYARLRFPEAFSTPAEDWPEDVRAAITAAMVDENSKVGSGASMRGWALPAFHDGVEACATAAMECFLPYRDGYTHWAMAIEFSGKSEKTLAPCGVQLNWWISSSDRSPPLDLADAMRRAIEGMKLTIIDESAEGPSHGSYAFVGNRITMLADTAAHLTAANRRHEKGQVLNDLRGQLTLARREARRHESQIAQIKLVVEAKSAAAERARLEYVGLSAKLKDPTRVEPSVKQPAPPPEPTAAAGDAILFALLDDVQTTLAQQQAENDQLRRDLFVLRTSTPNQPVSTTDEVVNDLSQPLDFQGLGAWSRQALGGRVHLHPRAIRAARKSDFNNPALAYRVLHALAEHYWPMKFEGDAAAKKRWDAFLAHERLSFGPTGQAVDDHRTADSYRVDWQQRRVPLDLHIQGSNARGQAQCFRLYLHNDVSRKVVVVGHLPSHLPAPEFA